MSEKKKKKDKKLGKLKNIAKGKISTKMYKGGSRSKVSAPTSRSVSSFTPGSKVAVDEQIQKETGSLKDIQANETDLKWLRGFKSAYDGAGGEAFKYQGKKYDSSDTRMGDLVTDMISKLSGGGGGGGDADKLFTDFTKTYVDYIASEMGKNWTRFADAYANDPNSNLGKIALNILNAPGLQSQYTSKTGNNPKVSGGGSGGGGGGTYSKAYQKWVESNFSKQLASGTSIDQLMGDQKVQGSYTSATGNKP